MGLLLDGFLRADEVLLGALVNAAGTQRNLRRVEQLWSDLTGNFKVVPHALAVAARAKAHLLCGQVWNVDSVMQNALESEKLGASSVECWIQATLVMSHSSLKKRDFKRLSLALTHGNTYMTTREPRDKLKRAVALSKRLRSEATSVSLSDLLITL